MCFYGVGKTLLEIPSPSSRGQFFVVLLGMRIPRLSNLARTFTYIIYFKEGGMPVLQPAFEGSVYGVRVGWDAWAGPGCVLCMVDHRGT